MFWLQTITWWKMVWSVYVGNVRHQTNQKCDEVKTYQFHFELTQQKNNWVNGAGKSIRAFDLITVVISHKQFSVIINHYLPLEIVWIIYDFTTEFVLLFRHRPLNYCMVWYHREDVEEFFNFNQLSSNKNSYWMCHIGNRWNFVWVKIQLKIYREIEKLLQNFANVICLDFFCREKVYAVFFFYFASRFENEF